MIANVVVVGDELRFDVPKAIRYIANYRSSLPISEILEVRATFPPDMEWAGAALTTMGGKRYDVPFSILDIFRARQDFMDDSLVLRNTKITQKPGSSLIELSIPKCISIVLVLVCLLLAFIAISIVL